MFVGALMVLVAQTAAAAGGFTVGWRTSTSPRMPPRASATAKYCTPIRRSRQIVSWAWASRFSSSSHLQRC